MLPALPFQPTRGRALDFNRRVQLLDFPPEGEEGVSRLLLRGERDVLEAADVDPAPLAIEPEGVGAAVELYLDVRPAGTSGISYVRVISTTKGAPAKRGGRTTGYTHSELRAAELIGGFPFTSPF